MVRLSWGLGRSQQHEVEQQQQQQQQSEPVAVGAKVTSNGPGVVRSVATSSGTWSVRGSGLQKQGVWTTGVHQRIRLTGIHQNIACDRFDRKTNRVRFGGGYEEEKRGGARQSQQQ